jgi:hypothetical protein
VSGPLQEREKGQGSDIWWTFVVDTYKAQSGGIVRAHREARAKCRRVHSWGKGRKADEESPNGKQWNEWRKSILQEVREEGTIGMEWDLPSCSQRRLAVLMILGEKRFPCGSRWQRKDFTKKQRL